MEAPSTSRARDLSRWVARLLPLLIASLVYFAFRPALEGEFLEWDDGENVVQNEALRAPLGEALGWMLTTNHMGHYHPLTWLSLKLDLAGVAPEEQPGIAEARRCHRTSLALHALVAIAFAVLCERILRLAFAARSPSGASLSLAALFAALFWALHPLRVESVAWVTERRDVLSALFLVLGVITWVRWAAGAPEPELRLRRALAALACSVSCLGLILSALNLDSAEGLSLRALGAWKLGFAAACFCGTVWIVAPRRRGLFALSVVLVLLSLLSKAWGMVLPAVLLLLDLHPLRRAKGGARAWLGLTLEKLPFWILSAVFGLLAVWAQSSQPDAMPSWKEHTLSERAVQSLYGLAFYPWKTLLPTGLLPFYELPRELRLADPRFAVPALLATTGIVVLWLARRRAPGAVASFVCMGILLSPVLGLLQAGPQLVADRYSYLAGMPLALLAGGAVLAWSAVGSRARGAAPALGAAALLALALATHRHCPVWRDTDTLWTHVLEREPGSAIANLALGNLRRRQALTSTDERETVRLLRDAERLYERGFATRDDDPRFSAKLAAIHGALAEREPELREEHMAQALAFSQRASELALETGRASYEVRLVHGANLLSLGRIEEALRELQRCVEERPEDAWAWTCLGQAWRAKPDPERAVEALERAVQLLPGHPVPWWEIAQARRAAGDAARALEAAERVLLIEPAHAGARALRNELLGGETPLFPGSGRPGDTERR